MAPRMASLNRGKVTFLTNEGIFVEVAELGMGYDIGPLEALGDSTIVYTPGDQVLLGSISGIYDDVVILGKLYLPVAPPVRIDAALTVAVITAATVA